MYEFSAEYLETTREGMWHDREALQDLSLSSRTRVVDIGAGSGAFTRVLREETPGEVLAVDADRRLLERVAPPRVLADGTRLPLPADTVDLAVCQALLVNLPDPAAAIDEFARVSWDLVATIEPDNSGVTVESTVEWEENLSERARSYYLAGSDRDPALGSAQTLFESAGLTDITVTQYDHVRTVEPPYSSQALESAKRRASGAGLDSDKQTLRAGGLTAEAYDSLRSDWREMGRQTVSQMQAGTYRRTETVPFFITVGRVPDA